MNTLDITGYAITVWTYYLLATLLEKVVIGNHISLNLLPI